MSFWDWVPAAITAGATLWGASQAADSNERATERAVAAQTEATAAQQAAIAEARRQNTIMQTQASPGLVGLQGIIGRGEALTPEQVRAIEDARRKTADSLQGSGLRGSARATVESIRDVEGRMAGDFMAQNRSRADSAAANLSGQYFNAGKNVSDLTLGAGNTASQGLINTGNLQAANIMGQGTIQGKAIGDIGAVIADQLKNDTTRQRDSSYQVMYPNTGTTVTFNGPRVNTGV